MSSENVRRAQGSHPFVKGFSTLLRHFFFRIFSLPLLTPPPLPLGLLFLRFQICYALRSFLQSLHRLTLSVLSLQTCGCFHLSFSRNHFTVEETKYDMTSLFKACRRSVLRLASLPACLRCLPTPPSSSTFPRLACRRFHVFFTSSLTSCLPGIRIPLCLSALLWLKKISTNPSLTACCSSSCHNKQVHACRCLTFLGVYLLDDSMCVL